MATPGSSRRSGGNKKEHQDSVNTKSNLSGLKHALHGTSYQLKLGIVVSLANIKKTLVSTEKFSFTVTSEDPAAGKFDDLIYVFQHGNITGTLKIQSKHKLSLSSCKSEVQDGNTPAREIEVKHNQESSIPKITLNDLIADSKNDFFIQQYLKSFCDQQQQQQQQQAIKNDVEGFIICTNADLDDDAKVIWNEIDASVLSDSTTSLDSYISSLFDKTGGKCYQLKTYYKRAALARLLVKAIISKKEMVTWQRPLFKEYRAAILDIIDKDSISDNIPSFKLTDNFLDPTYSNSKPGYVAFRKEFKEQLQKELELNETAWELFKANIRIHVAENFFLDEKNPFLSSDSFPDENDGKFFTSFCDRFRLVCGTCNEQELENAIIKVLRNLHFDDNHLVPDLLHVYNEESIVLERLFKANFDWLSDPFAKPLHSNDIKKGLENIENTLAYIKLRGASDKLREKYLRTPFRIRTRVLSDFYESVKSKNPQEVEAFDIRFGATVVSDMLDQQGKDSIFIEDHEIINLSKKEKIIFHSLPLYANCLIIICNGMDTVPLDVFKNYEIQVFLIKKPSNTKSNNHVESVNLSEFRVRDLIEQSWNQFLGETIPLYTTTILPSKIFLNNFQDLPIEEVFECLDCGKQMEENNEISKKYHEIERTYVHRPWVDEKSKLQAENMWWNKNSPVLKSIKEPHKEGMSYYEITNSFKNSQSFAKLFGKESNPDEEHDPIVGEEGKKVLILLGVAGLGKSTNITWLAWHLRQRNFASWVVRCNLSDHCSDFKPFTQRQKGAAKIDIDETEALRMLYKLLCSSLRIEPGMAQNCLLLLKGKANVSEDLTKKHGLSLNILLQLLVFKEKFNAGELVLLLDGFDEIAPYYKEVVLEFLSYFEQFKGVRKLYLTSRPYGFKKQFKIAFKDPSFFKLKPLSLHDKGSILFKMIEVKWNNGNIENEEVSDFHKSLCIMILSSLGGMSDVPLNLMMAVDILGDRVYHNGNINLQLSSKPFKIKLFETIVNLTKPSFTVEEFVKVKIQHRLYDKNGGNKNVADKPEEIDRFEKAIDKVKWLHGLVALWLLFNKNERNIILSANDIREGEDFMKKILEGSEKTGIIHGIQDGFPLFIHRSFAEYLAACCIIKLQKEENQQVRKKMCFLQLFWYEERKELWANVDSIFAKCQPLHLAIIERDWTIVESLLSTKPKLLYEKDDGKRTPLHLIALYYDFEKNWPHFLPDSIKSYLINAKEILVGWTALDFAFHMEKPRLIFYLLHHGASINVDVLYEQVVVSARNKKLRKAAKYARYVMSYMSHQAIEYDSHDACKKVKQFCDKVVADSANETSFWNRMYSLRFNDKEKSILKDAIEYDAVWMLKSVIQRAAIKNVFGTIQILKYFDKMLENNSILMVKYLMEKDSSILHDEHLWKCAVYAALNDYKIEFKYFVDLYCSRFKIKDFQPSSIESDDPDYSMIYLNSDAMDNVFRIMNSMCRAKLGIPAGIVIDGNILSLCVICVATVRPSMLRYLIKSCKLNLCASIVFSLAMITNHLFSKLNRETVINPSKAYECLLDLPLNISDIEANEMLRLAITSNLFQFSTCLIKRYNIDFQAVDESKGWNVFHLCASNQRSFWTEQIIEVNDGDDDDDDGSRASYADGNKTDLFRYMQVKASDMDCFGVFDKKGRSILHLAMENEQRDIVLLIVARKLGLNDLDEIANLTVVAIPNIIFCFHAIQEISKSVVEKWWHWYVLCWLGKRIVKISSTIDEPSQGPNNGRLFLQENAKELYEMAMKCRSLYLMYYLHREFPYAIPPPIYDADWLACTVDSLRSPLFLGVTKWLLNPTEVDQHGNLYEVFEKCDNAWYDLRSVDLEKLVNQVDSILSANRSVEEVCKLKLLAVAVCLTNESMIKRLFEALNVNIDMKVLFDIIVIAHQSYIDEPGTKESDGCTFENPDFVRSCKYLFERISNLGEKDAEGANVLHLATQNGLGCMAID